MCYSMFSAEHINNIVLFFTANNIIVINRVSKIYEIVIVQNLAIRYVTRFKLQKNVSNFKVMKMFVFAYRTLLCPYCLLYT